MGIRVCSRRFLASAVTIPVLAGGLVLVTPGVAEAVTCGQSWSNKDPNGSGTGKFDGTHYTIPMHTGIYGDCYVNAIVDVNKKLLYHCYRTNSYGHTWTHVRVEGTDVKGWVWDGNLNDNGSNYPC
jgi:hypothetical protein